MHTKNLHKFQRLSFSSSGVRKEETFFNEQTANFTNLWWVTLMTERWVAKSHSPSHFHSYIHNKTEFSHWNFPYLPVMEDKNITIDIRGGQSHSIFAVRNCHFQDTWHFLRVNAHQIIQYYKNASLTYWVFLLTEEHYVRARGNFTVSVRHRGSTVGALTIR